MRRGRVGIGMDNKRLIVVLGMHRSGTSAITRGLQVLGVELGDKLMPPIKGNNDKGFFEDVDINSLNIEMLQALGSDWHYLSPIEDSDIEELRKKGYYLRAVELLRQKVDDAPTFGFKDPRVAKLLPFWKQVFAYCKFDVRYILTVRHPLSVVQSLAKRDGFDSEKSYMLWLGHILTIISSTEGHKRVLVDYDRLIHTPGRELERIAECLALEIDPKELQRYKSEFLDDGLRHTVYDLNDLLLDDTCPPVVREIYTDLLDIAADSRRLDDEALHNHTALWINEFERLKSILRLVDRLSGQIANLNQAVAERDGQIVQLREREAQLQEQVIVLLTSAQESSARIASLNQAVAERDGRIAAILSSTSWRLTLPIRLVGDQFKRAHHLLRTAPQIIAHKGGFWRTSAAALRVYRREGRVGVKYRIKQLQTGSQSILDVVQMHKQTRKPSVLKRFIYWSLSILRNIYHKLPFPASFRLKGKTFFTRYLPKIINYFKRIKTINNEIDVIDVADQLCLFTFARDNPFKFGEKYHSYYSKLLSTIITETQSVLLDPPWYLNNISSNKPGVLNELPHPGIRQFKTRFTIICIVNNTPSYLLYSAINSVLNQSYEGWDFEIFVNEEGIWNTDILAMQFEKNVANIHFHTINFSGSHFSRVINSILNSVSDYIVFLNPYDELMNNALYSLAKEINSHKSHEIDLAYSRSSVFSTFIEKKHEQSTQCCEIPLSQLIAIKRGICVKKINNPSNQNQKNDLNQFIRQLLRSVDDFICITIDEDNYLFRPIPGRQVISLLNENGKLKTIEETIPLKVVVDARLINRNVTGTERYIKEILKKLSQIRNNEFNLEIKAITFDDPKEIIEGIDFITTGHLNEILNSHVFHKTFPASDNESLREIALAPSIIFIPHDLIAFNNPDYFPTEKNYYTFRQNLKIAAKLSDQIIAISNHGKSEIESSLNVANENIQVVYHGIGIQTDHILSKAKTNEDLINNLNISTDYFLFVGTDYPHKNLITLLKAFKVVIEHFPKASLVMVGTQYYIRPQPEVKELQKSLGGRVIQLGHVPDDVLQTLYRNAKALVFPSLYEGFGLPILEAMAFNTPVITTKCTSIPEVCGDAALLFDGYNVDQLAEYMIRIWTDEELRNHLTELGRINVKKYQWEKAARQTATAYYRTVEKAFALSPYQRIQSKNSIIKLNSQNRPTILIVTHIRFFPPTAGNEQRLFRLVRYLKKLGYQIVMLVNHFMEKNHLDNQKRNIIHQYVDYYEELGDHPTDKYKSNSASSQLKNSAILEKWQGTEFAFCPDEMMAKAKQLIQEFSPKIVVAEYIWTSRIFELAEKDSLKVIDLHDLFSRKKENVIKFGIKDDLAITQDEELDFINRCDVALAIQDYEAGILRKLKPSCEVISAGIDYENSFSPIAVGSRKSILVIGSDNQINCLCVNEFLSQAWPQINKNHPDAVLKIVGKVCYSIQGVHQNVELIPYIEDLAPVYHEASIVINPVYAGTGLKIKSVEALGHGKTLISWPDGVSGINVNTDSRPFIVVDSWGMLVDEASELLKNDVKRMALEELAKEYARNFLADIHVYKQVGDRFDVHSRREIKILCLYLRYGPNVYPGSLEKLIKWYQEKQQTANVTLTAWIIDNKIDKEYDGIDVATGFRLISGDNSQREFSGFQKVIEKFRKEVESYDVVHFVTSAFDQLFTGYREYFDLNHLYPILHRPLCLGHIDAYDKPVSLMGSTSQSWIRTCFFYISPQYIYTLRELNSIRDGSKFFDKTGKFLNNGNIDETYILYLKKWLYGEKMQGLVWHGTMKNDREFADKALSIINEHMLSIRLRSIGVNLVDYYWLMKNIGMIENAYDCPIPDSMEQVKIRQNGLFNN